MAFWKMRARNGIDYFADYLTEFHENMEAIVLAVKGKNPSTLSENDIAVMQDHLPAAKADWDRVLSANLNSELFNFGEAQVGKINQLLNAEKTALASLEATLKEGDPEEPIKAAAAIEPVFAKMFKMYGDFDRLS